MYGGSFSLHFTDDWIGWLESDLWERLGVTVLKFKSWILFGCFFSAVFKTFRVGYEQFAFILSYSSQLKVDLIFFVKS